MTNPDKVAVTVKNLLWSTVRSIYNLLLLSVGVIAQLTMTALTDRHGYGLLRYVVITFQQSFTKSSNFHMNYTV